MLAQHPFCPYSKVDVLNKKKRQRSRLRREASTVSAEVQTGQTEGDCTPPECKPLKGVGDCDTCFAWLHGREEGVFPLLRSSLLPCFLFKKTFRLLRVPQAVTPVTELISKMMYCIIFLFTLIYSLRRMHLC